MALNEEHFKNGLDQISSDLVTRNKQEEILEKAKNQLLELFLDDNAGLESHEDVEKAFQHVKNLLKTKYDNETNESKKSDLDSLRKSIQWSAHTYSKPDRFEGKDIDELKERTKQIKQLYDKITNITTPNKEIKRISPTIDKPQEEDQNTLYIKQRLLLDLINIDEEYDTGSDKQELKGKFSNLRDNLPLAIKHSIQAPKTDQEKSIKRLADKLSNKLQLTTLLPDKNTLLLPAHVENTEKTKQELLSTFTIDAHFMDKKNLILESERNRLRDLSEQKYREANWIKKIGMFATDRRSQNKNLEKSIAEKSGDGNNFIEQDSTQARIDGNIGTYIQQEKMGLDNHIIKNKTKPFTNDKINNIAHTYLMEGYDSDFIKNKEKAITNLNYIFKNEPSLQSIKMGGDMTGTDIMAQIDSVDRGAYQLQNDLDNINNKTNKIKINLIGLKKTSDSEELEGVRYDNLDRKKKGRNALGEEVFGEENFTEKLAKLLNLERGKKDLSGWSGIVGMGAKVGTGLALSTVLAPLGVLAGVTALGASLAWAKSRRDAIKEIAKTHEDAINLGMDEIEKHITEIEKNIDNATRRQKTMKHFGIGSVHTAMRQKKILESFKSMGSNGILKPTQELIQSLQNNNTGAMGEVLARIDAGHLRKTQFISTSQGGRNQTAIERNQLMNELRKTAMKTPLSTQDSQGNTISISVSKTSTLEEWKLYRKTLQQDSSYQSTMEMLYKGYDQVEKDIKTNKASIARNAAGNYVKTAAAMTAGGLIVGGIAGIHPGGADTQHEVVKTLQPHEHTGYELGKFDDANSLHNTSGLDQIQHGQNITIQGEAAVDGIKTHSSDSFLQHFQEHINQTDKLISDSSLNDETKKVLQNAISDDKVKHIMQIAKNAGADDGNARLVVERWREGMENITEHLVKHNMNDITIKDITFDENTVKDLFIQKSGTQMNAANRGFEAIVNIVKETKTGGTSTVLWDIPSLIKDNIRVPYTLPFSNTYAYTSAQDTATQVQDRGQSRTIDTTPSNNSPKARDNLYTS